MKKILIAALLTLNAGAFAQSQTAIYCQDKYSDQTFEYFTDGLRGGCMADLVWGSDNICFTGSAQEIAQLMNRGEFDRTSAGYYFEEAQFESDKVIFTGVDQQSFYRNLSDIMRCSAE